MHVFLGNGKTRVAQNSYNFSYSLNKANARTSKKRAAQGFHYINSCLSIFFDPIQKCTLSRSVQLEAVYFEALLYFCQLNWITCYWIVHLISKVCESFVQNTNSYTKNVSKKPRNQTNNAFWFIWPNCASLLFKMTCILH